MVFATLKHKHSGLIFPRECANFGGKQTTLSCENKIKIDYALLKNSFFFFFLLKVGNV
jgi:hypothetical protein